MAALEPGQVHPLTQSDDYTRQFDVPQALPQLLRDFASAAIKESPADLHQFGYEWFSARHEAAAAAAPAGRKASTSTLDTMAGPLGMRVTTREADVSGAEPLQADGLTNEALVDRISLLFTQADSDGNGSLSRKEFQEIFNLLAEELELSESDVMHILAEADENDNGVVEYKEFVPVAVDLVMALLAKESYASTARTRRSSAKEEAKDFLLKGLPKGELEMSIREVFRGVDVDGNGTLDRAEFLKCLRDSGLGFTRRELNLMMTVVDRDGNGVIDYEEFVPVAFNMLLDMMVRHLQDVPREEAALRQHVCDALHTNDRQRISHTDALESIMGANLGLTLVQVHAAMSECEEDPAEGTFNCEELAEAVAGMVMAMSELRGSDEGYKKATVTVGSESIEGMDGGAFTDKLRSVLAAVARPAAAPSLIVDAKEDVKEAVRAAFPGLNAQQLQALVLLSEPAKGGGWCCDKVVTWGFKTMQGLARSSYLKRKAEAGRGSITSGGASMASGGGDSGGGDSGGGSGGGGVGSLDDGME